jgi:hypothetical protein
MKANSEINEVYTARLGKKYSHVARYLRTWDRKGRNSYGDSVYKLRPREHSITFQSECLIPRKDKGRPRVLLLFSNPHPGSIQKGMFHSSDRRIANLWTDLCEVGLFSAEDSVLRSPKALRTHCLNVTYKDPFAFGFACYWVFPTSYPSQLKSLFGPTMEPPGLEDPEVRLNRLLKKWRPRAIISFNGKVFKALTDKDTRGYTKRLVRSTLEGRYPASDREYRVFQTYPTGWRFHADASRHRQDSLRRIANAIRQTRKNSCQTCLTG